MRTILYLCVSVYCISASFLYSGQRMALTTYLKIAATKNTPANNHPLYTLSFGDNQEVSCTLVPAGKHTPVINVSALEHAKALFTELTTALHGKRKIDQLIAFNTIKTDQHMGIAQYQVLVHDYLHMPEDKNAGPKLDAIDRALQELDEWVNPYLARLCLEAEKKLKNPEAKMPFFDYLTQHALSKAQ